MNPTENHQDNVLEIHHLSKSFGKNHVLHDVNLSVKSGSVLGLMGENGAGKSTMMKCLFGIYAMDEGDIYFANKSMKFHNPKNALESGLAMVHQELNQCLDRSVMDNLFLGRYPIKYGIVDEREMFDKAEALFERLSLHINPKTLMRTMSVSERQMVEIAKAVSYSAKLIVLDEPTSSLTEREVKKLFSMIRSLKEKGVSFIYISHKMDEIFEICDEVSVLRDGKLMMSKRVEETTMEELVSAMVGRSLRQRFPVLDNKPGRVIFEIRGLNTRFPPKLENISFSVRKGEIFGIYGLVGAGRSELFEAIFGLRSVRSGTIFYQKRKLSTLKTKDLISAHFAFITEERKASGIFPRADITFNICIASLHRHITHFVLNQKDMKRASEEEIKNMDIVCGGTDSNISSLSGGNQQKVVIAKWLETLPDLLLLDEPTRGIDVGAKYEIYELIIALAKKGKTCLIVSSEMPEILGITNRIAVMSNYRISGIVETKKTTQEELLRLSARYL